MSLFRRSKYGSSSHSSRAVLQQLLLRNAEVRSPRQRRLREKQLSSSTQRTASTTTEGTMYDQDNNSNNIDNGFWLAPNCLTDDSKDEIDFLFCQEEHNNNNNNNNNSAGPVIRARWRRRSADAVNDDPSLLLVVETPMPVADQSHNNNNNSRKDQVWMVTAREGRDDYDGSHIEEEAWGEQIEVLRRSSLNHTNNSKPFSSRGKGGFLRRTTKLFGFS